VRSLQTACFNMVKQNNTKNSHKMRIYERIQGLTKVSKFRLGNGNRELNIEARSCSRRTGHKTWTKLQLF
jgi:hypothetical protein